MTNKKDEANLITGKFQGVKVKRYSFFFLLFISFCPDAFSWGFIGHKIVAKIAEGELLPETQQEIAKLIPKQTLVDICTWADQVRNTAEYKHTAPWHYASIADDENYEDSEHHPGGDVVVAITNQVSILKNKKGPLNQRIEALKYLTHFVGDIHQPLHVGRSQDHGGNSIKLSYQGKETNLHALWDSAFIEEQAMTVEQFAQSLKSLENKEDNSKMDIPLPEIIKEDMSYRNDIYSFSDDTISKAYAQKATDIVKTRLYLGGKRLGAILNFALSR